VASIVQDDPSPLPGMHRELQCMHALRLAVRDAGALWAATTVRGKFGSEFEI